jgi:hypothetical protein
MPHRCVAIEDPSEDRGICVDRRNVRIAEDDVARIGDGCVPVTRMRSPSVVTRPLERSAASMYVRRFAPLTRDPSVPYGIAPPWLEPTP